MDDDLLAIQRYYPQIFHACHARHTRSRKDPWRLSERDQALLAHLAPHEGTRPSDLARHFGIGLPTLSEAAKRLERLGYVVRAPAGNDRRVRALWLTPEGARALQATSVLDPARLRDVVARLDARERRAAVHGLALLAGATRAGPGRAEGPARGRGGSAPHRKSGGRRGEAKR